MRVNFQILRLFHHLIILWLSTIFSLRFPTTFKWLKHFSYNIVCIIHRNKYFFCIILIFFNFKCLFLAKIQYNKKVYNDFALNLIRNNTFYFLYILYCVYILLYASFIQPQKRAFHQNSYYFIALFSTKKTYCIVYYFDKV